MHYLFLFRAFVCPLMIFNGRTSKFILQQRKYFLLIHIACYKPTLVNKIIHHFHSCEKMKGCSIKQSSVNRVGGCKCVFIAPQHFIMELKNYSLEKLLRMFLNWYTGVSKYSKLNNNSSYFKECSFRLDIFLMVYVLLWFYLENSTGEFIFDLFIISLAVYLMYHY